MRQHDFVTQFVSRVPTTLEPGTLYICLECNVVIHLCPCGCGEKVVLPIAPDQWHFNYDGEGVTLSPSIGNFQFPCRSHYFIRNNRVIWVPEDYSSSHKPQKKKKRHFWQHWRDHR